MDDLLWKSHPKVKQVHVEDYRAPSWSWAAIDAPVIYNEVSGETFCKLLDFSIQNIGPSNYGAVSAGWIRLNGPLQEIFVFAANPYPVFLCQGRNKELRSWGAASLDVVEAKGIDTNRNNTFRVNGALATYADDFWALRVKGEHVLLLGRRGKQSNELFVRIGVGELTGYGSGQFQGVENRTVTIS